MAFWEGLIVAAFLVALGVVIIVGSVTGFYCLVFWIINTLWSYFE